MRTLNSRASDVAPPDPAAFFETVHQAFGRAERAAGGIDRWYLVAGHPVRLRFAGPTLVPLIAPALEHLATAPVARPALTVCLWDVESLLPRVPAPPWRMHDDINSRASRSYSDERIHASFDMGTGVLSLVDGAADLAVYCVRDARRLPGYEIGAPLKPIFQRAMHGRGGQLVHAAAVGRPDGGVLLVGKGGSGKSTTALTCLGTELLYAADDYCMLSTDPVPYAHSLFNSAKVYAEDLGRFPRLAALPSRLDDLGIDKALLFLHPDQRDWITTGFPVRAILVPQVTGRPETSAVPISPAAALKALAPSTIFQLAGMDHSTLGTLAACVRRVPCYALRLGSTLSAIPAAIQDVLAQVSGGAR
ncbi:MAG TPA: serine kinase [bacterium]|nr:serine kinase [bacterium]